MLKWRNMKVGTPLIWRTNDFDGKVKKGCNILEVHSDHAIAICEGMKLWIDDDTAEDFKVA